MATNDARWDHVDAAVMSTAKALRRAYDAALEEQLGITLNEATVLAELAAERSLTQVELARRIGLSRARVGVHIDSLVAKGAVRREADPSDRRVWRVSLTPGGRSTWKRSTGITRRVRDRVHAGLDGDDLGALDRLLGAMRGNVAVGPEDGG
jgi:DNA-binding MarR family transcriptional regulator